MIIIIIKIDIGNELFLIIITIDVSKMLFFLTNVTWNLYVKYEFFSLKI